MELLPELVVASDKPGKAQGKGVVQEAAGPSGLRGSRAQRKPHSAPTEMKLTEGRFYKIMREYQRQMFAKKPELLKVDGGRLWMLPLKKAENNNLFCHENVTPAFFFQPELDTKFRNKWCQARNKNETCRKHLDKLTEVSDTCNWCETCQWAIKSFQP